MSFVFYNTQRSTLLHCSTTQQQLLPYPFAISVWLEERPVKHKMLANQKINPNASTACKSMRQPPSFSCKF